MNLLLLRRQTLPPQKKFSLAKKLYQSLRIYNKVKKTLDQSQERVGAKTARHQCNKNFWHLSKKVLENRTVADVQLSFSETAANSFFSYTYMYRAHPKCYQQPTWSWMPSPATPVANFNEEDIYLNETSLAVKKARFKSSPSPSDSLHYAVFKRCPTLLPALYDIFTF